MNKMFSKTLLRAGGLMMCVSLLPSVVAAQAHKPISLAGPESKLPFSDGIVAGNTLYIAGQEGRTADGKLAEGGTAGETRAALEAIQKVVKCRRLRDARHRLGECFPGRHQGLRRDEQGIQEHYAGPKAGACYRRGKWISRCCAHRNFGYCRKAITYLVRLFAEFLAGADDGC